MNRDNEQEKELKDMVDFVHLVNLTILNMAAIFIAIYHIASYHDVKQ